MQWICSCLGDTVGLSQSVFRKIEQTGPTAERALPWLPPWGRGISVNPDHFPDLGHGCRVDPSTISCFPLPFPLLRQSWSQQRALAASLILEAEVGGSSRPHPGTRWARGGDAGGGGRAPPPSTASLGGPRNTAKSGTWGRGKETPPPWLHLQVSGLLIRKKKKKKTTHSTLPLFFLKQTQARKKSSYYLVTTS